MSNESNIRVTFTDATLWLRIQSQLTDLAESDSTRRRIAESVAHYRTETRLSVESQDAEGVKLQSAGLRDIQGLSEVKRMVRELIAGLSHLHGEARSITFDGPLAWELVL